MAVMYLWMLGLKSEGGERQGSMSVLRALLAAIPARSFPGMATFSPKDHEQYHFVPLPLEP